MRLSVICYYVSFHFLQCILDDEYAIYDAVLVAFLFMKLPVRLLALNRTVLTLAAGASLDWGILAA